MPLIFEGLPPFDLRTLQTFSALSEGENVTLILRVIAPGQGPTPVPVHVGMTHKTATALAHQLESAALAAEQRSAENGKQS
jgi:hypothetical protein